MAFFKTAIFFFLLMNLSACVADGETPVLSSAVTQSASQSSEPAPSQPSPVEIASAPQVQQSPDISQNKIGPGAATMDANSAGADPGVRTSFASESETYEPVFKPRNKKTYLINGLASSVESIGYGFRNLSKKIPGSVLHNYASFVESSTVIRSKVTRQLKAAYREDPDVEINLIGISFGANIVTLIAADLDRAGIPVNYLVTMEGPAMVPVADNVRVADNFSCTNLDCFRTKSRLAWGNRTTRYATFKIRASHIPLADHPDVHRRIIAQINAPREPLVATQ